MLILMLFLVPLPTTDHHTDMLYFIQPSPNKAGSRHAWLYYTQNHHQVLHMDGAPRTATNMSKVKIRCRKKPSLPFGHRGLQHAPQALTVTEAVSCCKANHEGLQCTLPATIQDPQSTARKQQLCTVKRIWGVDALIRRPPVAILGLAPHRRRQWAGDPLAS